MKFLKYILLFALFFQPMKALCLEPTASLDEMIGQMIITGFHGTKISDKDVKTTLEQLEEGKIGGVILYEYNVINPNQVLDLTREIYKAKTKLAPFISVDEEGGIVQILNSQNGFYDFKTAEEISKQPAQDAYDMYFELSKMLNNHYFNLNFAPCVDLNIDEKSIIVKKKRSYGKNPDIVSNYAQKLIDAHNKNNVATSIKHFPGHGSIKEDTHSGFSDATKSFQKDEIVPYKKLMNNSKTMVMISHIYNKNFDEKYPASLSKNTVQKLLRDEMGFNGVVITDDVQMGAISKNYNLDEIVINSINAGVDIILFSNYDKPDYKIPEKVNSIVKQAIADGKIDKKRIEESYLRIKDFKSNLQNYEPNDVVNIEEIIKKYEDKKPQYWGEDAPYIKTRIRTNEKIVALTFDLCGSKNDNLDKKLVNFLIKEQIPATFFVTAKWIKKHPESFNFIANEPLFEIENHGTEHKPASINGKSIYGIKGTKNVKELIDEIEEQGKNIEKLTGRKPLFYRSGTAYYDEYAINVIEELNYRAIGFAILGDAGATYNAKKVEKAILSAKGGEILIFHANHPEKDTGKGVIKTLPKLKEKGFSFIKLEDYYQELY